MKKLLIVLISVIASLMPIATVNAQSKLCSMSASYRAIYQYPTGSYWQTQIANAPQYYANNNAYYQTKYGCQ